MSCYKVTPCDPHQDLVGLDIINTAGVADAFFASVVAGGGYFFGTIRTCANGCSFSMQKFYGCFKIESVSCSHWDCTVLTENFDYQNKGGSFYANCQVCLASNPTEPQGLWDGAFLGGNITWTIQQGICPNPPTVTFVNHVPDGFCSDGQWISGKGTGISILHGGVEVYHNDNAPDITTVSLEAGKCYVFNVCDKCGLSSASNLICMPDCKDCSGLTLGFNTTDEICGDSTGSINIFPTGGTGVYTYLWTGPNGFLSYQQNISGLKAGFYTIQLSDNGGCSTSQVIQVNNLTTSCGTCYSLSFCDGSNNPVNIKNPTFSGPLGTNPSSYIGRCFKATVSPPGTPPITKCFCLTSANCVDLSITGYDIVVTSVSNTCDECDPKPCWLLTNCKDSIDTYLVSTDLTSIVGSVINHVVIEASPSPVIDPLTCFLVSQADPCNTPDTLESHGTVYPDCECCQPQNQSPEPLPPRIYPEPVKHFTQVLISDCDIRNIKNFSTGYYSLFKTLKYGVTSCCTSYDSEALWLSNELTRLSMLNVPEVICKLPPKPLCHQIPKNSCNPCIPGIPFPV